MSIAVEILRVNVSTREQIAEYFQPTEGLIDLALSEPDFSALKKAEVDATQAISDPNKTRSFLAQISDDAVDSDISLSREQLCMIAASTLVPERLHHRTYRVISQKLPCVAVWQEQAMWDIAMDIDYASGFATTILPLSEREVLRLKNLAGAKSLLDIFKLRRDAIESYLQDRPPVSPTGALLVVPRIALAGADFGLDLYQRLYSVSEIFER